MPSSSPEQPIKLLTDELIAEVHKAASASARQRLNFNFHPSPDDNPHRFLNVLLADTYVTPHRHRMPPKAESFIVLRGSVIFLVFNDGGAVTHRYRLGDQISGAAAQGIDLAPGVWHTLVVDGEYAVIYEVKPGPYDATTDKEFAPWAPREGEPACVAYRSVLLATYPEINV